MALTLPSPHADRYIRVNHTADPQRILVSNIPYIITTDDHNHVRIIEGHSIYIERGVIRDLMPAHEEKPYLAKADLVYDASVRSGVIVTPGLVNAHAHPPMYLLRSSTVLSRESATTEESLVVARKIEQAMTVTDQTIAALGDFTEQQKMGTTTVLSHYHTPLATKPAARTAHIRLVDAISLASKTDPRANLQSALRATRDTDTLISSGLTIHTLARVSAKELASVRAALIKHPKLVLTIHCAETHTEVEACVERHGQRPIHVLKQAGLLNRRLVLSHAVHLNPDEIALIVKHQVGVVHLPTSNRTHMSGQFKYADFFALHGENRIALGTDSVISKSKLDIISEAFQSKLMHQDSPQPVWYKTLFQMMTINGARILGREHDLGRVWPGYKADLAFWKLKDRSFIPFNPATPETLLANLITHAGGNVRDLMVHGKFVISDRRHMLVDESKLLTQLQQHHIALQNRVGK